MWGIGLRPFAWNFYWLQWFIYTACVWVSIVVTSSGHNAVDKAKSDLGPTTTRIEDTVRILYPDASDIAVNVKADDIRGIGEGLILCTGFIGLVYILLQSMMLYERVQQRWVKKFVEVMASYRGQLWSLWFTVANWGFVILCTALATSIAQKHGNKISVNVDGTALSGDVIESILVQAGLPTRYWGHGYVRFMCISPWVQVVIAIPTIIVHFIAVRQTPKTPIASSSSAFAVDMISRPRDDSVSSDVEKPELGLEENYKASIPITTLK